MAYESNESWSKVHCHEIQQKPVQSKMLLVRRPIAGYWPSRWVWSHAARSNTLLSSIVLDVVEQKETAWDTCMGHWLSTATHQIHGMVVFKLIYLIMFSPWNNNFYYDAMRQGDHEWDLVVVAIAMHGRYESFFCTSFNVTIYIFFLNNNK